MVDVGPVLDALVRAGCRFVVVGSAATWLLDSVGEPRDLDVVVRDSDAHRSAAVAALATVGGWMQTAVGPRPIEALPVLPSLSWRVITAYVPVDVVFRLADGTGYVEHDAAAVDAVTAGGMTIRCHRTRTAA